MENILISACLMGCNTRYKGDSQATPFLTELMARYHLIPICPEQLGGLATPRDPSEIVGDRVVSIAGRDVTEQYSRGAEETLRLAKLYNCHTAILKERSPSCGHGTVYDGTFSGTLTTGDGITAALLLANGIRVVGESRIESELL